MLDCPASGSGLPEGASCHVGVDGAISILTGIAATSPSIPATPSTRSGSCAGQREALAYLEPSHEVPCNLAD